VHQLQWLKANKKEINFSDLSLFYILWNFN